MYAALIADTNATAAIWAAFGAVGAALVTGGLAAWTQRKRNPNTLMDTFISEVGADNDRLRDENENYRKTLEDFRGEMRKMKEDCDREIKEVREECNTRESQFRQQIFQLQMQIYNIQKGPSV